MVEEKKNKSRIRIKRDETTTPAAVVIERSKDKDEAVAEPIVVAERPEEKVEPIDIPNLSLPTSSEANVPTGQIKTPAPNGSAYQGGWSPVTQWWEFFRRAEMKFPQLPKYLLASMCVVESGGLHYNPDGSVLTRGQDSYDSVPAIGMMQVKLKYHAHRLPGVDGRTPEGNILLAGAVMDNAISIHGTWVEGFKQVYFPGDDKQTGTTQDAYIRTIRGLRQEIMDAVGATEPKPTPTPVPQPVVVDPFEVIMGGKYPPITYGWLADVGLNYYQYGVNHGTQRATQHTGVDIGVPCGSPLYAPADGLVDCVGSAGTPRWGQSCGAYGDVGGGGKGNLTILIDPGTVKLTLGHVREVFVRPGDRVRRGQKVATVGDMNGCHVHVETSINKNNSYWLMEPKQTLLSVMNTQPPLPPVDPHDDLVAHSLVGTSRKLFLPPDIAFIQIMTPMGANRQGRAMNPDGTVFHETGNARTGTGAEHHAKWQRDGTQGHPNNRPGGPNIGVHFYVDDRAVVQSFPVNEQGIHSGDERNLTKIAVELCVNGDRNPKQAERNAMFLHASLLRDIVSPATTATRSMWSHTISGCPAVINNSGRWKEVESETDRIIAGTSSPVPGPSPSPTARYAPLKPLSVRWTGDDVKIGIALFRAIKRTYRARRTGVEVRQYAYATSPVVRAPLSTDERVEGEWIVVGDDEQQWVVTTTGARIVAKDLIPIVTVKD